VTARPLDCELGQANGDMNDRSRFSNSSRIEMAIFGLLSFNQHQRVIIQQF